MVWTVDATTVRADSAVAKADGFNGGSPFGAFATDTSSAVAQLINFASVTLTAPLYTGVGGIFDPGLIWPFSTPVVGSRVSYDPTFITILSNGEIVSTSNTCAAEIQYNDGVNLNEVDIFITPNLVGYARATVSAQGSLDTSMLGAATDLVTAIGALSTSVPLLGSANDLATALGALSAAIKLAGSANDVSTAVGNLLGTSPSLVGAAADSASAAAALSAQIQLASAAADVTAAIAALTTQVRLAAAAISGSSAQGSLGSSVSLAGAAVDISSATGSVGGLLAVAEILVIPEASRTFKIQ